MVHTLSQLFSKIAPSIIPAFHDLQVQFETLPPNQGELVGISPLAYFGTIVLVVIVAFFLDIVFIIKACNKI